MRSFTAQLHGAVAAVCPDIAGVRIGDEADRSTWDATWPEDVSEERREQAVPAIKKTIDEFVVPA